MNLPFVCACVIHGDRYAWKYVQNLKKMLSRYLSAPVPLHVFTEAHRSVPEDMVKHSLVEWPEVSGTKRAWWYKMQMFDPQHALDRVLYFDLDVVLSGSLDWLLHLPAGQFWAIRDWRRLWKPQWSGINSSMMLWDSSHAPLVWQRFRDLGLSQSLRRYHGDQDLLSEVIPAADMRHFDDDLVKSWRWQIKDGGMDPKTRRYARPGAGSIIKPGTSVMVFHGNPKPHEVSEPVIQQLWNVV
jgi:hypothetical protein